MAIFSFFFFKLNLIISKYYGNWSVNESFRICQHRWNETLGLSIVLSIDDVLPLYGCFSSLTQVVSLAFKLVWWYRHDLKQHKISRFSSVSIGAIFIWKLSFTGIGIECLGYISKNGKKIINYIADRLSLLRNESKSI